MVRTVHSWPATTWIEVFESKIAVHDCIVQALLALCQELKNRRHFDSINARRMVKMYQHIFAEIVSRYWFFFLRYIFSFSIYFEKSKDYEWIRCDTRKKENMCSFTFVSLCCLSFLRNDTGRCGALRHNRSSIVSSQVLCSNNVDSGLWMKPSSTCALSRCWINDSIRTKKMSHSTHIIEWWFLFFRYIFCCCCTCVCPFFILKSPLQTRLLSYQKWDLSSLKAKFHCGI